MLRRSVNDPAATTQQAATLVRLEPMRPGQTHETRPRDKINKETIKLHCKIRKGVQKTV